MTNPSRSALLLMDFQNVLVERLGERAHSLLEHAQEARKLAKAAGMAVIHVRIALTDADYAAFPKHHKSYAAMSADRYLTEGSEATAIHSALSPAPDEEVFTKKRVGVFSTTNLRERLRQRDIETLHLAGITTSGVVLSTLRDAADHDYRLFVLSDVCDDHDIELHRVLMEKVFPRQAHVISLEMFNGAYGDHGCVGVGTKRFSKGIIL